MTLILAIIMMLASPPAFARLDVPLEQSKPASFLPKPLAGVAFEPKLGSQVPGEIRFRDERNQAVRLADYLGQRPVVLALAYYGCPNLCTAVLNGLVSGLRESGLTPGSDFEAVVASIDARERPRLAGSKKRAYLKAFGRRGAEPAWHFLTGEKDAIAALAAAVGFRFSYDSSTDQFAHPAGILVLTPKGRIAGFFPGIRFDPAELRASVAAAARGKTLTSIRQALLYCFRYDPLSGKNGPAVLRAVRLGAVATLLALALGLAIAVRRARRGGMFSLLGFPLLPERASTLAGPYDRLFFSLVGVLSLLLLIVSAVIVYCCVRYREGRSADRAGANRASLKLEVAWTIVPLMAAFTLFLAAAAMFFRMYAAPEGAMEIHVVPKQWMWKFEHADGRREINELHVPTGRPVKLLMTSQDVIHSFFVPAFRIKQDVLPGRTTSAWFEALLPGEYHLFCAEYCGTEHSLMRGRVIAMEPPAFARWLSAPASAEPKPGAGKASAALPAAGRKLYEKLGCIACHGDHAQGTVAAPALKGLYGTKVKLETGEEVVADENYLRESIVAPQAKIVKGYGPTMPTFQGQVSEEDLNALVAYIKSLKGGAI